MSDINTCSLYDECKNADKSCPRCFNLKLYAPFKEKQGLRAKSAKKVEKKEGMDFENLGTKKYNNAVRFAKEAAHRQINSGAIKSLPGDMITEEELTASLAEFKERGSKTARGEKVISIQKKWLEQMKEEAKYLNKEYFFLPFRYKNDDTEYVVMEYDILLSYVQTIQTLVESNRLLREMIEKENGVE